MEPFFCHECQFEFQMHILKYSIQIRKETFSRFFQQAKINCVYTMPWKLILWRSWGKWSFYSVSHSQILCSNWYLNSLFSLGSFVPVWFCEFFSETFSPLCHLANFSTKTQLRHHLLRVTLTQPSPGLSFQLGTIINNMFIVIFINV